MKHCQECKRKFRGRLTVSVKSHDAHALSTASAMLLRSWGVDQGIIKLSLQAEAEEDNDIRMQELEFVSSRPSAHFPSSLSACGGSSLIGFLGPRLPKEATDKDHGLIVTSSGF
jgi:hypothetical protein